MFKFLKKEKKEPENIEEVLASFKKLESKVEKLEQRLSKLKKKSRKHVQKISVVRFNPFSEVGGDQSFSVALLDENNDGMVLTSYYSHDSNRVYAKPIKEGKSEYSLSKEEEKAIARAIRAESTLKENK